MEKPQSHITTQNKKCGVPFEDWSRRGTSSTLVRTKSSKEVLKTRAVDGLFEGINDCMSDSAEVPQEVFGAKSFTLVNDDYSCKT